MSEIYNCENLKDYLFCGLYYRYKHEFNLPYRPINANEIYTQSMNAAIFIIINGWGLKRKHPRTFIAEAAEEWGIDPKAEMYKLPAMHVGSYAERDAEVTFGLWQEMKKEIIKDGNLFV